MFTYKFKSEQAAASAMYEQILACLSNEKTLYIKQDPRLSPGIERKLLELLSQKFEIMLYDQLLSNYIKHIDSYKLSFGLEPLLYIHPELYNQFSVIYSFDGSFCWFISQLKPQSSSTPIPTLFIGADLSLPETSSAPSSTKNYIAENASSQITPFQDKPQFHIKILASDTYQNQPLPTMFMVTT